MNGNALKVIPLGGLGEIGRNMMALEYGNDIVVIDAGVLFPDAQTMPGVDFIIPDITYLTRNKEKVRAILITHGHEDHIGALPYVLADLPVPVYSSRLTHGLITVKLREHGMLKDARLNVMEPHFPFSVGLFKVEFFRVCHSIPDAMGIAVTTPLGTVIHTGDFKIDHTPVDGRSTDFASLALIAEQGVLLLCSDSTYAEVAGYTPSEQVVGEAIDRAMGDAKGRVMVATFASLVSRMQQVIDAAVKHGRKVAVVGRSMIGNSKMAASMGYLNVPEGTLISLNEARKLPHNEVVILATGAQGEPTSALVRIANGEHRDVEVVKGDTVIISASPIPGNETVVYDTIDNLLRQGAHVLYSKIALVHVHGHASQEELKMMLSLVKPKYFVPVHGEYRHMVAHAGLAKAMGIPDDNVFVLEDGDILELDQYGGDVVGRAPAGHVFMDGQRMLSNRARAGDEAARAAVPAAASAGADGVVEVLLFVDRRNNIIVTPPGIVTSGFVPLEESQELLEKVSENAQIPLERRPKRGVDWDNVRDEVAASVSVFLYEETGRRPAVVVKIEDA
ncbi:MAG: ribonuclease J [SAR202 cluster bacterium]|nr:ribonuclease J [SAR202 cluster bacterium]